MEIIVENGNLEQKEMSVISELNRWKVPGLLGWLIVTFAAAALGAGATVQAKAFYGQVVRPAWTRLPIFLGQSGHFCTQ